VDVLLVEDDADLRALLTRQLAQRGHTVAAYETAEAALAAAEEVPPLVLLDVGLPDMDGLDLCRRLRERPGGEYAVILIVTGHDRPEDLAAALDAGASDFFAKPFRPGEFRVRLAIAERRSDDAQARRRAEQALLEREAYQRALLEHAWDIIAVLDAGGVRRYVSPACERLLGYRSDELLGQHVSLIAHPDDRERTRRFFDDLARRPDATDGIELRVHHRDGSTRWLEIIATNRLNDLHVRGIVANARDVTERKVKADELAYQAQHDALTGLANRSSFEQRLERVLAGPERQQAALLLLDLDGFKAVNDRYGHAAGDAVLVATAERLRSTVRKDDLVARFGGDEFVVILPTPDNPAAAIAVAERIVAALGAPFRAEGQTVRIGCSVGVAFAQDGLDAGRLVRQADARLYAAKAAGKARVVAG
jgi:diguanylate cyclase (GGDEF)-like protein/PAS domain S-box-containing protein